MAKDKSTRIYKVEIVVAGGISILAQALMLLPFYFIAKLHLAEWGILTIGIVLFAVATIWSASRIKHLRTGWRGNAHFILNQAIIVIGIFLLTETFDSFTHLSGFIITGLTTALTAYGIIANITSPTLIADDTGSDNKEDTSVKESVRLADPAFQSESLKEQLAIAQKKISAEKQKNTQLTYLIELSRQLSDELDQPVAAQIAVNSLERAIDCTLVSIMLYEVDRKEFVALATSGSMTHILPPGFRQDAGKGLNGRVNRQKKTIIVNDTSLEPDFAPNNNENTRSTIIAPMMSQGQLRGLLEVRSDKPHAFTNMDIANVEGVAAELTRAWERANYNQRLTELIQSGISLTTLLDPQASVQEVAILARKTFEARFVFVTLLDQQGDFSRSAHAGDAPRLLASLNENPANEPLLQGALNATQPFRVRDLRKYTGGSALDIDNSNLRSVLAAPIRLHRLSIGTILAFGKDEGVFFSKNDESLADLLSSQAAASVESSWLYQELRNTLNITSMLRQLSEDVIMTEEISHAAETIARAAHKAANASETGIILMDAEGRIQAKVELNAKGFHTEQRHPMETIDQAIQTGQSMFVSKDAGTLVCYPLLTRSRPAGAIWMEIPESRGQNFANFQLLANQAAVSLERVNLLAESRRQAREIEAAYEELEATYDQTLKALMSALDARDRETEGHSMRVSRLASLLGEKIGLNSDQLKALKRGALLHDIGKIGISDSILHKPGKLTDEEWKIMRLHPEIGARIIERIPFLQESMSVVRYHHERWDGSGYPLGLSGSDIPIDARIFAVVDVFDALTSKRSYRSKSTPEDTIEYLRNESGRLFDGEVVEQLAKLPYHEFVEGGNPT